MIIRLKYIVAMLLSLLILTGCNFSGSNHQASKLVNIQIAPSPITTQGSSSVQLAKGNQQQYVATATYANGKTADITSEVSWETSDATIASIDSQGMVTAVTEGSVTVSASSSNVSSNTAQLTVTEAELTALQITPAVASIAKGQTQQYVATGTYTDDTTADITGTVTWSSSATNIAAITNTGLVTGTSEGDSTISASKGAITSNTATVTVTSAVLSSLQISTPSNTLAKGMVKTLTAVATYSDNSTTDVTTTATWLSSDESILTISSDGVAHAVAVGNATVTASLNGVSSNSQVITVSTAELTSIQVTPAVTTIAKGLTQQYKAIGTYTDSSTVDITDAVSWSSSNTAQATVSTSGLVTAVDVGNVDILATDADTGINQSATLTVSAAQLSAIQINASKSSIAKGTSLQYQAIGTYTDNSTVDISQQVSWHSSDAAIATISSAGAVFAVAEGNVTISAFSDDIASNNASLAITAAEITSIQVTPAVTSVAIGNSVQYQATATFTDSTTQDITAAVDWSSSNTTMVTIDADGLATAVVYADATVGDVQITASKSAVSSNSATLTVTAAILTAIQVTPATTSIPNGLTQQYKAIGTYSDASTVDITDSVSWQSSVSAATIDDAGLATATATGNTTISANLNGVNSNNATLTVTAAELTKIDITPVTVSVAQGLTQQYLATGTYTDDSTQNITGSVSWNSSDTDVATISTTGLAQTVAAGNTTISATVVSAGVNSNAASLTVTPVALMSIEISPEDASIAKGLNQQYSATGHYSDSTTQDLTDSVSWSSSTGVTTISATGLAQGVAVGSASITATLNDVSNSTGLTITAAEVNGVTIEPTVTSLMVGNGRVLQYQATATFTDGSSADITSTASWTSSNTDAATIDAGLATAVTIGQSTTITASSNGYSDTASLTAISTTDLSMCGAAINDTDQTNGTGSCIKVVAGTTGDAAGLLFTGDPSINVIKTMGYIRDANSTDNTGYSYSQPIGNYVAFYASGLGWDSDTGSATYGADGQYDRYCQDLAAIGFNGYTGWRRVTYQELYDLAGSTDMGASYGWSYGTYWSSTLAYQEGNINNPGFDTMELDGTPQEAGRVPSYQYAATCVVNQQSLVSGAIHNPKPAFAGFYLFYQ